MKDARPSPVSHGPSLHLMPYPAMGGSSLPELPDTLIGREEDIQRLLHLIDASPPRLLTLTGAGGTGKTRLAIELATRLRDRFADGVAFVSLSAVTSVDHVIDTIARALGIHETAGETVAHRLVTQLRTEQRLLVLDNFEHLLPAATVVSSLVAECPHLTVLVTSRAPLHLALERVVVVTPLTLPDSGDGADVGHSAAVQLFVEAAREVAPDFTLAASNADAVAAICRRLDGLPLAIRLAASRSRVLDPRSLLARLDPRLPLLSDTTRDAPERQQTMRNAIGWSWDLLGERERALLRHLSVFAGGFTLETAEALGHELRRLDHDETALATPAEDTSLLLLDTLETLVDHHLVEREERNGDIRFGMLDTIREYALDQLEASGETGAVRAAHAAAMTAWLERVNPLMSLADQAQWLARGSAEQPNIRAAMEWAVEHGDAATAHRIAAANGPVWRRDSMFREAQGWLQRILALPGPVPAGTVCVCRFLAGAIALSLGDRNLAMEHANAGLTLAQQAGDHLGQALAHQATCSILLDTDLDAAQQANEAALACLRALPDPGTVMSMLLWDRAVIAYLRGDHASFGRRAGDAHDHAVAIEDQFSVVLTLFLRARAAVLDTRWVEAAAHLREALDIAEPLGSTLLLAGVLQVGALLASACGDHRLAVRWMAAGSAADASLGVVIESVFLAWEQAAAENARKALGPGAVQIGEAAALTVPLATLIDEVRHYRPGKRASGPTSLRLTPREEDVLRLIASGLTDNQIGETLFIARPTVSKHVGNILAKLDVPTRTAAVDTARRLGLIDDPPQAPYT